jgi:hypothetical protein
LRQGFRETLQGGQRHGQPLVSRLAYTDGFHLFPPPPGGRVLFLGLGAGIGPRQMALLYEADVTTVELHARVVQVAGARFGAVPGTVLVEEGRGALERLAGPYDLIVIDAFGAGDHPGRLATVEAFARCRQLLAEPGTLAVNIGGTLGGRAGRVFASLLAAFPNARAFGVSPDARFDPDVPGNTIGFGFVGPVPDVTRDRPDILPFLEAIARAPIKPPKADPWRDASVPGRLPIE